MGRFMLSLALLVQSCLAFCSRVFFFSPVSIVITSIGKESWSVLLVHLYFYFARVNFCPFSLPHDWCKGLAAVCDCGTPCTFLLTFLLKI